MAALITSDEPLRTAAALAEGPLNLYKTLEQMHLAKAMATGLITWDALQEWTSQTQTPTRRIPEDTTWAQVVRPTQTPYIDVNRRPPRTTIMRRQQQEVLQGDFQDLREGYPPQDPAQLELQFNRLRDAPRSPHTTTVCRFGQNPLRHSHMGAKRQADRCCDTEPQTTGTYYYGIPTMGPLN